MFQVLQAHPIGARDMAESVGRVGEKVTYGVKVVIDSARLAADSAMSATRLTIETNLS